MSQTIDKRVVEMSFDNSNFEKNVSQSVSTLDKLKKALKLDGVGKGLQEIDQATKGINLSGLADGVEALQRRFSVLGEIGHNAMMKVANSVTSLSTSLFRFVADGIKSGGISRAMNLEKANFQLQGLLKDNEQVAAIMQNVSDSVDGTAYSLDAAAMAASMFAATGMRAGDQMYSALRAVAGVAAMTSSEYSDVSRIFTTVAGQGRVMADQLNQLAARGLNAAATMTDYFNKVGITTNATEADIRKLVSEGKVSFEMFAAAMDDAFGEHAKAANETFTGAMANIRSALARIGADFVTPLVKQNGELVKLFNAIRVKINEIRKLTTPYATAAANAIAYVSGQLADFISGVYEGNSVTIILGQLWGTLYNVFKAVKSILYPIQLAFKEVFPEGLVGIIASITFAIQQLTSHLRLNWDQMVILKNVFVVIFSLFKTFANAIGPAVTSVFSLLTRYVTPLTKQLDKFFLNISDNLRNMAKWASQNDILGKSISAIHSAITKTTSTIKIWFNSFKQMPQVQTALETLKKVFGEIYTAGVKTFDELWRVFTSFFNKLKDIQNLKFSDFKDLFVGIKDAIVNNFGTIATKVFENFKSMLLSIRSAASDSTNVIASAFEWLRDKISSVVGVIKDLLGKLPIGTFVTIGIGAAILHFVKKINEAFQTLAGPLKGVTGVLKGVANVLNGFAKIEKAKAMQMYAESVYTIAKAIAVLAVAMIALAQVPADSLKSAGIALAGLSVGLIALAAAFAAINKFLGGNGLKGVGTSFLGLSASLAIIVFVLKKMDGMSLESCKDQLLLLGTVLLALLASVGLLAKLDNDVSKNSLAMLAMAASLKILVGSLAKLADVDTSAAMANMVPLTLLLVMTAALLKVSQECDWGSALTLVGAAVAIRLMVDTVKLIAKMEPADVAKGILVMGMFELLLIAVMAAARLAGETGASAGTAFIAFAASMVILSFAIKSIAKISDDDLARGLIVITAATAIFMGVALLSRIAGEHGGDAALTILAFSASMILLGAALHIIAAVDPSGLERAVTAVAILGLVMTGIVGMSSIAKDVKSTLITISVAMVVLSLCLAGLSLIEPDRLMGATAALSILMGALSVVVASTSLAKEANSTIAVITLVVTALAGILILMSAMNVQNALVNAEALSVLLLALSAAMVILSYVKDPSEDAIVAMFALTGVVAALALVLAGIAALDVAPSMEQLAPLMAMLAELTAIILIFDKGNLGADAQANAVNGALALIEFIGILGAAIMAIGALFSVDVLNLDAILDKGLEVLGKLGTGLGEFIGNFLGGIVAGFLNTTGPAFVKFGVMFSMAIANMMPGLKLLDTVPDGLDSKIGQIVTIIAAISAAEIINGISKILPFSSSIEDLGKTLTDFAEMMKGFGEKLKEVNIDEGKVETVQRCADILNALQHAMVNTGGWLQDFLGEKLDLGEFGERVKKFIDAMVDVSKSLEGVEIQEAAITTMANLGKLFAELQGALPREGGALQDFLGTNLDLTTFGERIKGFVTLMIETSGLLEGVEIQEAAITTMANLGKLFAELQEILPNVGGVVQDFLGEQMDLSTFGQQVRLFTNSMINVSNLLSANPINEEAVTSLKNAGDMMAELQNALPPTDGVLQEWFGGGTMSLSDFGQNIRKFAADMQYVAIYAKKISSSSLYNFTNGVKKVVEIFDILPQDESYFDGKMSISAFGTKLVTFGGHMKAFIESVSGANFLSMGLMVAQLRSLVDIFKDMKDMNADGIENLSTSLKQLAEKGLKSFTDTFDNSGPSIQATVDRFIATFVNSITFDSNVLSVPFQDLINNALLTLVNASEDFRQAATQLTASFATGLAAGKVLASTGAVMLCQAILNAVNSTASSMGPSAGVALVNAIITGIQSMQTKAVLTVNLLVTAFLIAINSKQPLFVTAGASLIDKLSQGMTSKQVTAVFAINSIINALLLTLATANSRFQEAGSVITEKIADGITARQEYARFAISSLLDLMVSALRTGFQRMFDAGDYLVQGLVNGVNQNAWKAKDAATNLANQLTNTINTALKIHSPSQVAEEQGMFYGEGLVNGLTAAIKPVATAGNDLAKGLEAGVDAGLSAVYAQGYEIGKKIMYNIVEGLKKNTGDLTKAMKEIMDSVIPSAIEAIGGLGDSITAKIKEGIKASDDLGKIMAEKLDVLSEDSEKTLTDLGAKVMEKINEGMQQAKDKIPELLTEILNEITPKILQNIGTASTDLITEKILAGMGEAKGYTDSMKERLTEFFSDMDDPYFELGKQLMTKINEGMQSVKDELPKVLSEIVTEISSKVLESIGSATTESITEKVLKGIEEYGGMSDQLKNKFTGFFPELDEPYFELGKTLMTKINDGMVSVKDVIPGVLKEIITEITGSVLENVGQATMELITGKIMKGITEFQGFSDFMKEKLTGFAPDLDQPMFDIGVKIITKISDGMKSVDGDLELAILGIIGQTIPKVRDAFGDFSDAIVEELKTAMKAFDEFGTMMVEVITSSKDDILNQMQILGAGMVEQMQFGMFEDQMAVFGPINRMMLIALDQVGVLSYDVGSKIIEQLVSGINDHSKNASKAIETPISTALSGSLDKFKSLGREFMTGILSAPAELLSQSLNSVGEELSEDFYVFGEKIVKNMANGIDVGSKWPIDAIASVASTIINRVRQSYTQFYQAGDYLMQGFANGMRGGTYRVVNAAVEAARAATEAFNRELQIKSPSRVGEKSGGFYTAGIAKGILGGIANITNASRRIATEAKETLDSAMTSVIESLGESDGFHPTITPILDLDDLKQEMTTLDTMFTRNKVMSIGASIEASRSRDVDENQNESEKDKKVQYNFTQNNYSPKALSRLEIYRQSKNLLSAAATKRRATT